MMLEVVLVVMVTVEVTVRRELVSTHVTGALLPKTMIHVIGIIVGVVVAMVVVAIIIIVVVIVVDVIAAAVVVISIITAVVVITIKIKAC